MKNEQITSDQDMPLWFRILNIEDSEFERSKYAGQSHGEGKFRLKNLNIMRRLAPGIYESAAEDVKEYSDALFEHKGMLKKYNLGRKLGSIPMIDMALHPELVNDYKAQDKYFMDHQELKVK